MYSSVWWGSPVKDPPRPPPDSAFSFYLLEEMWEETLTRLLYLMCWQQGRAVNTQNDSDRIESNVQQIKKNVTIYN